MLRLVAPLLFLILCPHIAAGQEPLDPDSISGVVNVDSSEQNSTREIAISANPEIMEREAETALTREDYATAVSLFSAACVLQGQANCDRAYQVLDEQDGLVLPPHMPVILAQNACSSGVDSGCLRLDALLTDADTACADLDADACAQAGMIRLLGHEREPDPRRGAEDYGKACDLGNWDACLDYAHIASAGTILSLDPDQVQQAFERSCRETHPHNCTISGLHYASHSATLEKLSLAESFLEKGCGYGDDFACSELERWRK
ncbi:MAG: hypothetical protein AAFP81_15660 [Pseudomonadota bacterium]